MNEIILNISSVDDDMEYEINFDLYSQSPVLFYFIEEYNDEKYIREEIFRFISEKEKLKNKIKKIIDNKYPEFKSTPKEELLQLQEINFNLEEKTICLIFNSPLEEEHGIGILIREEKYDIGGSDICYEGVG